MVFLSLHFLQPPFPGLAICLRTTGWGCDRGRSRSTEGENSSSRSGAAYSFGSRSSSWTERPGEWEEHAQSAQSGYRSLCTPESGELSGQRQDPAELLCLGRKQGTAVPRSHRESDATLTSHIMKLLRDKPQ